MDSIALNDEEAKKYHEKLLKRREYQKQYMAKKRASDPEYVKKSNEIRNEKKKERYKNDETYRDKEREYGKKYSAQERAKMKLAMEHYKATFGVGI
jgi:hypothetical protein